MKDLRQKIEGKTNFFFEAPAGCQKPGLLRKITAFGVGRNLKWLDLTDPDPHIYGQIYATD